ncbi:helix-turn-helix domain-containing protein [Deinococcus multiflagellatus]|uniref:Helix-turn-helix domain-containing protein n=1 Tax=Deinococcus multiflagellatus TaxID=1656887 RepID=A0ABW1ZS09_9DEIO|nr:helix-turn-helix domain-containing protein [Deinococcus multiflagellatus]MBZ9714891.1 helix-turn-helix domain-containing protein [Deinococcus multiflagellatus]
MTVDEFEQLISCRLRQLPARDPQVKKIATALGVTAPFIRQLVKGERRIPPRHLHALSTHVGLSYAITVIDSRTGQAVKAPAGDELEPLP